MARQSKSEVEMNAWVDSELMSFSRPIARHGNRVSVKAAELGLHGLGLIRSRLDPKQP